MAHGCDQLLLKLNDSVILLKFSVKPGGHIIATIAQKKLRDQNDYMETMRSAIVTIAIAEIEHFLSQRS